MQETERQITRRERKRVTLTGSQRRAVARMIGDESTNWTRYWPTDVHQEPNYLRAHTWDDHSDRALLALLTGCNYKGGQMNATYGLNETDCQLI